MAKTSFMQNSFLGGEFSPFSQGLSNTKEYYSGMNLCLNYIPTDEGGLTRRPGFRFSAEARANAVKLIPFYTAAGSSYVCELTDLKMRFHQFGALRVSGSPKNVLSISTATPAVVETSDAHGWSTGDTVVFPADTLNSDSSPHLFNRQFLITVTDSTHFSLAHTGSLGTGPVDGSVFAAVVFGAEQVDRVTEVTTPFTSAQIGDVRHTEEADNLYLFHGSHEPNILDGGTLVLTESAFEDGPYLDQNETATTLAFSGVSGSVTVTASTSIFASTDTGRLIRVNSGTATAPDWSWLKITAFATGTSVTATVMGPALASASATTLWRLGVFSNTTGWPTHGVVHEGRLWLISDAFPGRIDGSKPFDFFNFEPTAQDGTVADDNGVSATAAGIGRKNFQWLLVTETGLLAGSDSSEWLVRASALDDPLTPFTIQIRQVTAYGAADVLPIRAGRNSLFVQSLGRALIEHRNEGGAFDGADIARRGRHLTPQGMVELAYSKVPVPIVWVRRADQRLIAVSYRNELDGQQAGWHRHNPAFSDDPYDAAELAAGRHTFVNAQGPVLSIATAPFSDVENTRNDSLWAAILRNGAASVEYMMPVFDDTQNPNEAFHVDSGNVYKQEDLGVTWVLLDAATNTYRFYGLDRAIGDSVDLAWRGVDLGSGVVQAGGYIDLVVPDVLESADSAYETVFETQYTESAPVFASGVDAVDYAAEPNSIGHPCPQSTVFVGEDGVRYFVRGSTATSVGDDNTVYVYNADTGAAVASKTPAQLQSDATAAGIVPVNATVDNSGETLAVAVPDTPFVVVIVAGAGGVSTGKRVLYYKMNSSGALTLVGGYAGSTGGTDVQFSPPSGSGDNARAAGHIIGAAVSGSNNTIGYKYPIAVAYYGEGRSTLMVLPAINKIIADTPLIEDLADHWRLKELSIGGLGLTYGDDIFGLTGSPFGPANNSRGFFLPRANNGGSLFCQLFYSADLAEHAAGTASPLDPFLATHAGTYSDGLISAIGIRAITSGTDAFGLSRHARSGYVNFHTRFLNSDGSAAFPFADEGLKRDGTAAATNESYYCNPTILPVNTSDANQPWYIFFPHIYRNTADKEYVGIRIFRWDPVAAKATFVSYTEGRVYQSGIDIAATVAPIDANVYWNRATGQLTLLLFLHALGEHALMTAEFGDFDVTAGTVEVPADTHVDAVIGLNYSSRGQILRPDLNSGAQNGPGLGKLRRTDRFNGLFYRTGQIKFGAKFTDLKELVLADPDSLGRRPLFSGVSAIRSLQDTYGYDSMMAFEQSRPNPGGIVALAGHIQTNDI